jgi:hypothetical protein
MVTWLVNNELESIWKEVAMSWVTILSFSGEDGENYEKP